MVNKLKSLLQPRNRSILLPSVLFPLFALCLWGYLENPDWLEATVEQNASTGEILNTDPNSAVTEADLALGDFTTTTEADSVTDLLQQISLSQTANAESGETSPDARKETNPLLGQPTKRKPNVETNNPFAAAIQSVLTGKATSATVQTKDPFKFSPLLSSKSTQNSNNLLEQALANLESEPTPGETEATETPILPLNPVNPAATATRSRGSSPTLTTPSSESLVGQGVYIPGQVPTVVPGQNSATSRRNSGFIAPTTGTTYYPSQRGTGGYQVTPGGATYTRQRGNTGSVVTQQGIVGPRSRGGVGSVLTPQGTTYTRQRGSTGFTDPPTSTTTTTTTTTSSPATAVPNNVPQ